jgi:hypothetical protein
MIVVAEFEVDVESRPNHHFTRQDVKENFCRLNYIYLVFKYMLTISPELCCIIYSLSMSAQF